MNLKEDFLKTMSPEYNSNNPDFDGNIKSEKIDDGVELLENKYNVILSKSTKKSTYCVVDSMLCSKQLRISNYDKLNTDYSIDDSTIVSIVVNSSIKIDMDKCLLEQNGTTYPIGNLTNGSEFVITTDGSMKQFNKEITINISSEDAEELSVIHAEGYTIISTKNYDIILDNVVVTLLVNDVKVLNCVGDLKIKTKSIIENKSKTVKTVLLKDRADFYCRKVRYIE